MKFLADGPPGLPSPSALERRIQEAIAAGEFDNLPGKGKPIPGLREPYDEMWWAKALLRREGVSAISEQLSLRAWAAAELDGALALADETEVKRRVEAVNARIRATNRRTVSGPSTELSPVPVGEFLGRWRQQRVSGSE